MTDGSRVLVGVGLILLGCSKGSAGGGSGGLGPDSAPSGGRGAVSASGGTGSDGGGGAVVAGGARQDAGSGGKGLVPEPRYHPPSGFDDCMHAEVKANCSDGWCKLPPSCFVMGSPESEWGHRGRDTENQVAVTLTHWIEVQEVELTRAAWTEITGTPAPDSEGCSEPRCPVGMVSWWDAVHTANLLSEQKGLKPCYEPVGCSGTLGKDLVCTGVADPTKSVYECEGYRLPTRAEAEYAARAGTISTWYSGDITEYWPDNECAKDPALELIAWYCNNSDDRAHVGGELRSNGFGLYDIIGNLGEWTNEAAHYSSSPGGKDPRGSVEFNSRRLRLSPQYDVKSWNTRTANMLSAPWDARGPQGGFRLVRTLPD